MRRITGEWLKLAQNDLRVADHSLSLWPVPMEIICYHCHQSVEKTLKGVLAEYDIEPPRTHDLTRLCGMCVQHNPKFTELEKKCREMVPYAAQLRYPEGAEVTEEQMNAALKDSHIIFDFARSVLEEGTEHREN